MSNAGYAMAEEASPRVEASKKSTVKSNFFKRWLLKIVKEEVANERIQENKYRNEAISVKQLSTLGTPSTIDNTERSIQFTVHVANGGRVIETRKYDRLKDRHSNGLYVITNEQDFGKEIDKIITMEALK